MKFRRNIVFFFHDVMVNVFQMRRYVSERKV